MNFSLLNLLDQNGTDTVSLIGMAKNVGKTEALNHLIREASCQKRILGVTSSGLDGEGKDLVYLSKKPLIWLPENTLAVTAESCLLKASLKFSILDDTGFQNALGQIFLIRVKAAGFLELAGPPIRKQIQAVIGMMKEAGSAAVIVDGALNRTASAGPTVTKGSILCTGSTVAGSLERIVCKTAAKFAQLSLPLAPEPVTSLYHHRTAGNITLIDQEGKMTSISLPTILGNENKILTMIKKENKESFLIVEGAVSNQLLDLFTANARDLSETQLVVRKGTDIFADEQRWNRYIHRHGKISVLEPINLLAVTVNPYKAFGKSCSSSEMVARIAEKIQSIKPVPVLDVVSGLSR